MLTLDNIVVGYGRHRVLNGLDLRTDSGCTVILGPNGAGKTTLFRVGAGVLEPTRGTVSIRGEDPFENPEVKREVGYIPHIPSLTPGLPVRENLQFWGRALGLDPDYVHARIDELADALDFRKLLAKDGGKLSRGQSQRIAIARGLLAEPSLLFLDEPTTGLDPSIRPKLLDLLRDLAESDRTLVYTTHNLHEANELADKVALLHDGEIIAADSKDEIIDQQRGTREMRVKLTSDGGVSQIRDLGYDPTVEGEYVRFEIGPETTATDIIETFGEKGLEVEDVKTDDDPLQTFFEKIDREGK